METREIKVIKPKEIRSARHCRESHKTRKEAELERELHSFDHKNERIPEHDRKLRSGVPSIDTLFVLLLVAQETGASPSF